MYRNESSDSSELIDELRTVWEHAETVPDLASLLRRTRQLTPEEMLDFCLIDQSYRWRTAAPLTVEDYLVLCPALRDNPGLLFELAYGELRTRRQLRGALPAGEIEARFPEFASRLHKQLEVGSWLEHAAPRPASMALPQICSLHRSGRVGPYELGEPIAHGGMGVIFRARHVDLNRVVALKMIRPDRVPREVDQRRFHNESVTIAQLDHPHIVPIYDMGEEAGVHYFAMKLLEGGDLQQHCRRYLDDPRGAARVMVDVADAVHHAHQRGVLHRDVKPSNVLLDEAGRAHVTDFGLARPLDEQLHLTDTGDLLGTPAYLAPEQLTPDQRPLTVAADVYGLGAVLYVLLTGQPPFDDSHLVTLLEHIRRREPVPPRRLNPRVEGDLEQVCLKALAKQPGDRYGSAREFADDLQRCLSGEGVRARPLPWWRRRWRWVLRHPDLAVVAGLILLAAVSLLWLLGVQTARVQTLRRSLADSVQAAQGGAAAAAADRRDAERLRKSAAELEAEAAAHRAEAIEQRRRARESAYAAAIYRAERAWQAGDSTEFSRLLDEQLPRADEPDVRGFEWFLLDRQRPCPERLETFVGPVRSVAYSPNGRRLAAAGDPGTIQVWDTQTGQVVASWLSLTTTRDLAFAPDGRRLAAVGDDGRLRLYSTGESAPEVWPVATVPVWQVAFVGDGPLLATCDQDGQVRLLDRQQGTIVATLASPPGVIQSLAVAPDGRWLVTGDREGRLKFWDAATCQPVHEFWYPAGVKSQMKCVAVSTDGTLVAGGDTNDFVRVFTIRRPWAETCILEGRHFDRVQEVAFSPDGRRVAGCDKNGNVRVWRLPATPTGGVSEPQAPEMAWQGHQGRAYGLAFHPQLPRLATVGQENQVALWTLHNSEDRLAVGAGDRHITGLAFSSNGTTLAVAAPDGVQLWNAQTRRLETRLARQNAPRDQVALTRDGRYLAAIREESRVVEVWRQTPQGYRFHWERTDQAGDRLLWSPAGDVLVVANWGGDELVVHDAESGRVERRIHAKQTWGGAFSPDGRQLAFTEQDDVVLWDWPARQPLRRLRGHHSTATDVTYSADGRRLASCGNDRRVLLWDAASGAILRTMMGHRIDVEQVAFAGRDRLVSLDDDGIVLVWHTELGTQLWCLHDDPANPCLRLAVSPNHRRLAARLTDGRVELLDLSCQ